MQRSGGDCFIVKHREQFDQPCSEMQPPEEKMCIFITDNKAEEQSHESEWSDRCKHHTRYAQADSAKVMQRTEMELNQKSYGLPDYSSFNKHHGSSSETLKDKTNVEVIHKTIAAASHSNSVAWRVKELIEIEVSKYEASKRELQQLKQIFQEFIKQFDPTNESQNSTKRANLTDISSVLENEKDLSSSSDSYIKPNPYFKVTNAKSLLSKDINMHTSLPIENKRDQFSEYESKLKKKLSRPNSEIAMGVALHKLPCKAQENLESCSFKHPKENACSQQMVLGCPGPDFNNVDRSSSQKVHASTDNEQKILELMWIEMEENDYFKQKYSVSGFANDLMQTDLSSVGIYEGPSMVETKIENLMKHQKQAYRSGEDSLEVLENSLKILGDEKEKLNKAVEKMQADRRAMSRDRTQPVPKANRLEACSLQNYVCESVNRNLRAQDRKDIEISQLKSELDIHKTQLCTTCQIQLKTEDDLNKGLSKCKSEAFSLGSTIEEKENQIKELKRHIHDMQNEKDNISLWNVNLLCKVQESKNEARQHNRYVADYISINEKLLKLAQRKEEEVNFLAKQVASLHMVLSKTTEENKSLSETLKALRKQMAGLREQNIILKQDNDLMKSKFLNTEMELMKRKESFDRISPQLAAVVQNRDPLLAESEELWRQLQDAKYKHFQIEAVLINSNNVINDLTENIYCRDNEMHRLRAELKETMKQNGWLKQTEEAKDKDLQTLQSEMANLWHKVEALEEEVMEKEGQISILKGLFSEEILY